MYFFDVYFVIFLTLVLYLVVSNILSSYVNEDMLQIYYFILLSYLAIVSTYVMSYSLSVEFSEIITPLGYKYVNTDGFFLFIFGLDNVSCLFSAVTIQIAFFVNLYSYFYHKNNPTSLWFFFLLNFFFVFMVLFIHSKNILTLFLFWECIGISSYFLINFYFIKSICGKSALKALTFNKWSDCLLLTAFFIFYKSTNTCFLDMSSFAVFINNCYSIKILSFNFNSVLIFSSFICFAAFSKSAQLGFHFWLPDSMEAPLPASALIHSATLVAAGINLLIRFSIIINFNVGLVYFILIYASLTYLYGAVVSCFQSDLKKILAYSTISNCGLIIVAIFVGDCNLALIFFSIHGWYKSLSFLVGGHLINYSYHKQDVRQHSSGKFIILAQCAVIVLTLASLSSWFFMCNSLVKHEITQYKNYDFFFKWTILMGTHYSAVYSLKALMQINSLHFKSIKNDTPSVNIYFMYSIYFFVFFFSIFFFLYRYAHIISINCIFTKYQIYFFIIFLLLSLYSFRD